MGAVSPKGRRRMHGIEMGPTEWIVNAFALGLRGSSCEGMRLASAAWPHESASAETGGEGGIGLASLPRLRRALRGSDFEPGGFFSSSHVAISRAALRRRERWRRGRDSNPRYP